ncbi:MAG: bifunctional nuclease family protein [Actinobacteria bacterium]|nr:bifunctional nuclease family protein [Actinomycetota bacterium]
MNYHALDVIGVRVEIPSNQPIVLLREIGGVRYLPIWIGAVEATAIAFAQQGVTPPRPLTHDLMKDVLGALQVSIDSIHLTELKEGIFYSLINLKGGVTISSRPSDAIALALRTGAPILASEALLGDAGIEIPEQSDDEVEKFKEFLDQVTPEDFAG